MTPEDEGRHQASDLATWHEAWDFEFWIPDGLIGGWVSLVRFPNWGRAWYHAFLAGPQRQLLAVVDHEVPWPERGLEFRSTGLWATHIMEAAFEHWTIGLEAFALGVDDPVELYGRQFGDQVPLGFDLEWEASASPIEAGVDGGVEHATAYEQPCDVHGEVLVGGDAFDIDGVGWREHRWGPWPGVPSRRLRGRHEDGRWLRAAAGVDAGGLDAGGLDAGGLDAAVLDAEGLPVAASVVVGGETLALEPVAVTPLQATGPDGLSWRLPRALVRIETATGRSNYGWWSVATASDG